MAESSSTTPPSDTPVSTYFAPPERMDHAQVLIWSRFVQKNQLLQAILDSVDGLMMILNPQRQVLAVNRQLLEALGVPASECIAGGRPGEILGCTHAAEGPGGCGTARACATCGAVAAILSSQRTEQSASGECLATVHRGATTESLEFRVRATPVGLDDKAFTVLVFNDISGDKRREVLERTFFHDVLNTVGGLMGWSTLLQRLDTLDPREAAGRIMVLSQRLKQEIEDQRRLSQAESGTLTTQLRPTPVSAVFQSLRAVFEAHDAARGRTLELVPPPPAAEVLTDPSLLERVLINMIKNALEAAAAGQTVKVWFELEAAAMPGTGRPVFSVHNPSVIPEPIAQRIFQRSFSTKSPQGRGIGTYSMKLFGERYLKGEVGFFSNEAQGTVFWFKLPAADPAP